MTLRSNLLAITIMCNIHVGPKICTQNISIDYYPIVCMRSSKIPDYNSQQENISALERIYGSRYASVGAEILENDGGEENKYQLENFYWFIVKSCTRLFTSHMLTTVDQKKENFA